MPKNCVFKVSVNTQKWAKAAAVRAVKTMAQTAIAVIGTSAVVSAVDWKMVVSASIVAGLVSLLTSVAGNYKSNQSNCKTVVCESEKLWK